MHLMAPLTPSDHFEMKISYLQRWHLTILEYSMIRLIKHNYNIWSVFLPRVFTTTRYVYFSSCFGTDVVSMFGSILYEMCTGFNITEKCICKGKGQCSRDSTLREMVMHLVFGALYVSIITLAQWQQITSCIIWKR